MDGRLLGSDRDPFWQRFQEQLEVKLDSATKSQSEAPESIRRCLVVRIAQRLACVGSFCVMEPRSTLRNH
jgi:hypothetical protein